MSVIRADGVAGKLSADLASGGTTMTSAGLADLPAVASPDIAKITLFATDNNGRVTSKEIVYVTAHTASATTATITRAQEGTTSPASWSGTTTPTSWVHAPTGRDWSQSTKVRRAATTQTLANNTLTNITFDTEDWDDEGIYNPGTDATKITVVTAGRYRLSATGAIATAGTSTIVEQWSILVNGSAVVANVFSCPTQSPGLTSMSTMVTLAVGDYVQLQGYQNSGGSMTTNSTYPTGLVVERVP